MRATPLRFIAALALLGTASAVQASTPQPSSPLFVSMTCESGYCEAVANGGSGVYSFSWANAWEISEDMFLSAAEPACYTSGTITVSVRVTDSNGASARTSRLYNC